MGATAWDPPHMTPGFMGNNEVQALIVALQVPAPDKYSSSAMSAPQMPQNGAEPSTVSACEAAAASTGLPRPIAERIKQSERPVGNGKGV